VATSPIHYDLAREARGYGLTFLAGGLMLIFADRVARSGRRRDLIGRGVAGVIGGFTIPQFVIGFVGQAIPLVLRRDLRKPVLAMVAGVGIILLLLYAPLLAEIVRSPGTVGGLSLPWHGFLTAPAQDLLRPNLDVLLNRNTDAYAITRFFPDTLLAGTLAAVGAVVLWGNHERMTCALLLVPVLLVYTFLTVTRFHVHERYGSFLLLHALLLAAVGIVGLIQLMPSTAIRYLGAGVALGLAVVTVDHAWERSRVFHEMPRENFKGAAQIVEAHGASRVLTDSTRADGLRYYLGDGNVVAFPAWALEALFCSSYPPPVFIEHPFRLGGPQPALPDLGCLKRRGAVRTRVTQRTEPGWIDVWLLPRR
jgi:hypothetical protein